MRRFDVVIAGGGLVGTSLALALSRVRRGALSVALIDRAGPQAEDRAFALSAGSRRLFEALGIWHRVAGAAEPIREMVITDSRLEDPVRPIFLTFGGEAAPGEPFAHMVPEAAPLKALHAALVSSGVEVIEGSVEDSRADEAGATLTLSQERIMRASLVIACDGARSRLREQANIGWAHWSYRQSGIVATIGTERSLEGRAEEHFLPSGPFAILPLADKRFSMVWTERDERVPALLARDDLSLLDEIEKRAGFKLGRLSLLTRPRAYPLGFGLARKFGAARLALVGDAAHLIHPIAGQGLNLGLRDVAALVELISDHCALGLDPGSAQVIDAYDRARRADTVAMASVTDALNRLFSNDAMPVRLLRDLGLGIVDRLPSVKTRLMREASASNPHLPKLMRGEALPGF